MFLQQNGSGSLEHNNNGAVTATIHVLNGRNFTAFISIYGHGVKQLSNAPEFPSTKSFTFVYRHSRTQSRNRSVSLGQRQPNDNLLAVKRKTVRIRNRFAQDDFQYEDINHFITKITISFDVRHSNSLLYIFVCVSITPIFIFICSRQPVWHL